MPTKVKIPVRYKPVTVKLELPKDVVEELELYVDISKENDGDIGDEKTLRDRVVEGLLRQCFDRDNEFKKSIKLRKQELAESKQKELADSEPKEALNVSAAASGSEEGGHLENDVPKVPVLRGSLAESKKPPTRERAESGKTPDRKPNAAIASISSETSPEEDSNAIRQIADAIAETDAGKSSGVPQEKNAKGDRDSGDIADAEGGGNGKDLNHGIDPQATDPGIEEVENLFDVS